MHSSLPWLPMISALAIAISAAALMGFAIQRGATCMVAAVDEAVRSGRFTRAFALAETSLWVAGLLALFALLGGDEPARISYPTGGLVLLGGALLGFGALLNGACVFGSIARFGSGERYYILTPLGFYLGSLLDHALATPQASPSQVPPSQFAVWAAFLVFLPFAALRLGEVALAARRKRLAAKLWLAHHATIVIGVSFVILLLVAGPWTYSQVLTRVAHGGMAVGAQEILLFLALLAGAVAGGWSKRERVRWSLPAAASCLAGGALMGVGSALIPGGNDNLVLVGLPMFQAYAWLAISAMAAAIWSGLIIRAKARKLPPDSVGGKVPAG